MLSITIPAAELWDESKQEFVYTKERTLQLEHSLVSLAKWESKWCKPFLTKEHKTAEEFLDYIKCMTITQNVDPIIYQCLTDENIKQIKEYINAPMTATTFSRTTQKGRINNEQVTNELIYWWMIANNIPSKYEKWHLNRLLTLIKVCNVKNQPAKKMRSSDILAENARINAERLKRLGTKG